MEADRTSGRKALISMNPVERAIRRVDQVQQRHTPLAFGFGVIKKLGDDNGGVLVNNLAYAGFVSVFPLLLVLVTVLVKVAAGDPALRSAVVDAVTAQFPKQVGQQLANNIPALDRSSLVSLVVGLLLLVWGASGLAQAGLFTMAQVWNLPGPARPGYFPRLGRSALFLAVLGGGVIVSTALSALPAFGNHLVVLTVLAQALAVVANVGLYFISFRVLTPKGVPSRDLVPGAIAGGIAWSAVLALGLLIVRLYLHSDSVYGIFGTVLGLLAWIYLGVRITVYAAEINVVLKRRLWPRSIVQPPLTEADRTSIALQALQNQRREEQDVEVTFTDRPEQPPPAHPAPRTPEEVAPPATPRGRRQA